MKKSVFLPVAVVVLVLSAVTSYTLTAERSVQYDAAKCECYGGDASCFFDGTRCPKHGEKCKCFKSPTICCKQPRIEKSQQPSEAAVEFCQSRCPKKVGDEVCNAQCRYKKGHDGGHCCLKFHDF